MVEEKNVSWLHPTPLTNSTFAGMVLVINSDRAYEGP